MTAMKIVIKVQITGGKSRRLAVDLDKGIKMPFMVRFLEASIPDSSDEKVWESLGRTAIKTAMREHEYARSELVVVLRELARRNLIHDGEVLTVE